VAVHHFVESSIAFSSIPLRIRLSTQRWCWKLWGWMDWLFPLRTVITGFNCRLLCDYWSVFMPVLQKSFSAGGICFWSFLEWVCASWKPCEHHISKTSGGNFTKFWSQMYFGFIDVLIRFWGQRSRSHGSDGSSLSSILLFWCDKTIWDGDRQTALHNVACRGCINYTEFTEVPQRKLRFSVHQMS